MFEFVFEFFGASSSNEIRSPDMLLVSFSAVGLVEFEGSVCDFSKALL